MLQKLYLNPTQLQNPGFSHSTHSSHGQEPRAQGYLFNGFKNSNTVFCNDYLLFPDEEN